MSPLLLVALFGAGVSSIVAPCVLPLLPVYVAVVLDAATRGGRAAVLRSALHFVGGFTAVFVGLGVAAGALGGAVGGVAGGLSRAGGVVLLVMGALMLLGPRGPAGRQWRLLRALPAAGSRWRPVVLGVAFGAAWTPCVGPLLGTALVAAAATGGPATGAALLTAYSLGLAVPFLILCLLATATGGLLPGPARRFGARSVAWQRLAACLVLALGLALAADHTTLLVAVAASS